MDNGLVWTLWIGVDILAHIFSEVHICPYTSTSVHKVHCLLKMKGIIIVLIMITHSLFGSSEELKSLPDSYYECRAAALPYEYNPHVPEPLWHELEPYFLPHNHPIKKKLDRFFSQKRVTLSQESFEKAGFNKIKMRKPDNIVVGKHHRFSGYLFKVFLDTQPVVAEWDNWVKRIEGARSIKECIKKHHFNDFVVPKKWIYPLPEFPAPPDDPHYLRKNFILIVEDMRISKSKDNLDAYKNKMTHGQLFALFTLLTEVGLIDSVFPDNAPFTLRGKIAFIDTEHHHLAPVPYHKLTRHLAPSMQTYWESLWKNGT